MCTLHRFFLKRPVHIGAASSSEPCAHVTGDEVPMLSAEPVLIETPEHQAVVAGVDNFSEHDAHKQKNKKHKVHYSVVLTETLKLESIGNDTLSWLCKNHGLPCHGNKAKLTARLTAKQLEMRETRVRADIARERSSMTQEDHDIATTAVVHDADAKIQNLLKSHSVSMPMWVTPVITSLMMMSAAIRWPTMDSPPRTDLPFPLRHVGKKDINGEEIHALGYRHDICVFKATWCVLRDKAFSER